jgi:hypothetical protein
MYLNVIDKLFATVILMRTTRPGLSKLFLVSDQEDYGPDDAKKNSITK